METQNLPVLSIAPDATTFDATSPDATFPDATAPDATVLLRAEESERDLKAEPKSESKPLRKSVHHVHALPPLSVVVRDLHAADAAHLEWHGGEDLRDWYRSQWANHQSGDVRVLIADFNGFPIGQAAIHWQGKPTHPSIPDLQSLRVMKVFRGLGLGTLLLDCAENLVAQSGHTQISLAVGVKNPRARSLYERLSYNVIGEPYDDEWTYRNARGETCTACETVFDMVKNLALHSNDEY